MADNHLSPWVIVFAVVVLCGMIFVAGWYLGSVAPKPADNYYKSDNTDYDADLDTGLDEIQDGGPSNVENIAPVKHEDGTLVKQEGGNWIYLIEDGKKRMLRMNVDTYRSKHSGAKNVVIISAEEMDLYPIGPDVTKESESHRHHDRDYDHDDDEDEEEEEEEETSVYDVKLAGCDEVARSVREISEGVLADDHYMRGKLHYPFTLNRPEEDLLQVEFSDVEENSDGSYDIVGTIPSFDETEIEAVYIMAAVVDEDGRFSKTRTMKYTDSPGVIETRVEKGDMEDDPDMIAFSISYLAAGDMGRKFTAISVSDGSLASDFMDSSVGAIAGTYAMQGRVVYPFTLARPEEDPLQVTFRGVVDGNDEVTIVGRVSDFDEAKIKAVHISAAAVDWNGKYSEQGTATVKNSGADFKIKVGKNGMSELPNEIVFEAVYEPVE